MNIIDLRKKLLQSSEQRVYCDRRKVAYQFGSPEWLEYIKNNDFDCPEEERRHFIRRKADRELSVLDNSNVENCHNRLFLTTGEKRLLQDIYLTDFDDKE
jgi:hypothetical protein